MAHDATDLKVRTKKFALRIIKLYQSLPKSGEAQSAPDFNQLKGTGIEIRQVFGYGIEDRLCASSINGKVEPA